MNEFNGFDIYDIFSSGAKNIISYEDKLNSINVFPIADGDTGSNLAYTMKGILINGKRLEHAGKTLDSISNAALLDSYGNSGTIFASYLCGLSSEVKHMSKLTIEEFAIAASKGAEFAYNSIAKPVEGTILTIMKEWALFLCKNHDNHTDMKSLFTESIIHTKSILNNTKGQIKALSEANVVDAGALGFVLFLEGMLDNLISGISGIINNYDTKHVKIDHTQPNKRYCVEMTVEPSDDFNTDAITTQLSAFCDSIIMQRVNGFIKLHVHTDEPSSVADAITSTSKIIRSKADDMLQQSKMHNKKSKIGIVTDSIADIPSEIINSNLVSIIPLSIIASRNVYNDRITIKNEKLFKMIEDEKVSVTSAQPSDVYIEKTLKMMCNNFDHIIGVFVSSQMSGIYDKAYTIAKRLKLDNIEIFDTKTNSAAEGLIISNIYKKIIDGDSFDEICSDISNTIKKVKIFVEIQDLYYATISGRVPKLLGTVASALKLKAVISIDKEGKGIITRERNITSVARKISSKSNISKFAIVYTGDINNQSKAISNIEKVIGFKASYVQEASGIVSAFVGKNAIGIAILEE